MAPHPIPLPCALAFPPPSHRDATTPSPCWAPHFMTQERIMFSNPTPSEPRLSPAATMSDDTLSALTPPCTAPLSCSLQPLLKLSLLSLRQSLLQFVSIVSLLLNHGNPIFEPVCVFLPFFLLPLLFWCKWTSVCVFTFFSSAESRKSDLWTCVCFELFFSLPIWSLSPQRFHYYFYLSIVSLQYQKYSTILILVLCLLCVTPLVCSSYSSFARPTRVFTFLQQLMTKRKFELFTHSEVKIAFIIARKEIM